MSSLKMIEVLKEEGVKISARKILAESLEKMDHVEVHLGLSILDKIAKIVKKRTDEMKGRLIEEAKERGEMMDSGSRKVILEDGEYMAVKRSGKEVFDMDKVKNLLEKKELLDASSVFSKRTVIDFDEKAFKALLTVGHITRDEYRECVTKKKSTWSLRHKKPSYLGKLLKS